MFFEGDLSVGAEVTEKEEEQAEAIEQEQIEAYGSVE